MLTTGQQHEARCISPLRPPTALDSEVGTLPLRLVETAFLLPPPAAPRTGDTMPPDGVEPPTPAFSGLAKSAKSVISSSAKECKGTPGNAQEPLLFLRNKAREFINLLRGWIGYRASKAKG